MTDGHRPEDFLAGDAHLVGRFGEQRRLQVVARRLALQQFAAGGELGAFLLADLDVVGVLLELARIDHRADLDALLQRIADLEVAHALGQRLDELVVDAFGDDDARRRRAALAGREERRSARRVSTATLRSASSSTMVGFLPPISSWNLRIDLDAGFRHALAGADRAGEGDGVDVLAVEDRLADDRALAHHEVQHALGQAGAMQDIDDRPRASPAPGRPA